MLAPTRLLEPLRDFLREEAAGGILLMIAAAVALVVANSPRGDAWDALWHTSLGVVVGDHEWSMSLVHWVNDGLMAIFFLVVGLEIKRELRMGELREPEAGDAAHRGGGRRRHRARAHLPRASTRAVRVHRAGACRWPRTSRSRWVSWPSSGRGCRRRSRCS